MASPTQWTWVWVDSGSWWWTGRPGVLRFMGSQRVGHDWASELNWLRTIAWKMQIQEALELCSAGWQDRGGLQRQNPQNYISLSRIIIGTDKKYGCLSSKDWLGLKRLPGYRRRSWDQKAPAGSCWQIIVLRMVWWCLQVKKIQVPSNAGTCLKPHPQGLTSSIFNAWSTATPYWVLNAFFSLMVKADVQCMFNRPQNKLFWLA